MALKTKSIRGTRDIPPSESHKWQYIERVALETAACFGMRELRLPTIEKTELFVRSVGESTDVVQKEMYTFEKGRESITLRPEATAGMVRAVIENNLLAGALPLRLCHILSCFRHENPQSGRLREFHQFDVEVFGSQSPTADAEVIAVAGELLARLGAGEVALEINSIGCPACRPGYNRALVEYYRAHYDKLCFTCRGRLEQNPLRLLDCKEESCAALAEKAPKMIDYLCPECADHFAGLKERLGVIGIAYTVNSSIVRGLDYYTKTVFEFVSKSAGAQGTVCGGGRYDLLAEQMGGPPTPAIGFAMGLERLLMVLEAAGAAFPEPPVPDIYIGGVGGAGEIKALALCSSLRRMGLSAECDCMGRSVKAQMKYADKIGARYSCVIGDNELAANAVVLKNMITGESRETALEAEAVREGIG